MDTKLARRIPRRLLATFTALALLQASTQAQLTQRYVVVGSTSAQVNYEFVLCGAGSCSSCVADIKCPAGGPGSAGDWADDIAADINASGAYTAVVIKKSPSHGVIDITGSGPFEFYAGTQPCQFDCSNLTAVGFGIASAVRITGPQDGDVRVYQIVSLGPTKTPLPAWTPVAMALAFLVGGASLLRRRAHLRAA